MSKIEYKPYVETKASHENAKCDLKKERFMDKIEYLPYDEVKASYKNVKYDVEKGYSFIDGFVNEGFGFNCLLPDDSILKTKPCEDGTYLWYDLGSICRYFRYVVDKYGAISVYDIKKALAPIDLYLKDAEFEDTRYGYTNPNFFTLKPVRGGLSFTIVEDPIDLR